MVHWCKKAVDCIRASSEVTGNGLPVTGLPSKCAKPCYTWILQRRASISTKSENDFSTSPNWYADSRGAPIGGKHLPDSACPFFVTFTIIMIFTTIPPFSPTRFIIVHGRFGEGAGTSGGCASKQERSTCGRESRVVLTGQWTLGSCTKPARLDPVPCISSISSISSCGIWPVAVVVWGIGDPRPAPAQCDRLCSGHLRGVRLDLHLLYVSVCAYSYINTYTYTYTYTYTDTYTEGPQHACTATCKARFDTPLGISPNTDSISEQSIRWDGGGSCTLISDRTWTWTLLLLVL